MARSAYEIRRYRENAIVGTTLGLSLQGYQAMMEMQFADFVIVGFNQIVNNLARSITVGAARRCGDSHAKPVAAWVRALSQPEQ